MRKVFLQSFRTQRTPEEEEAAEAELLAKAEAAAKGATPLGAFWCVIAALPSITSKCEWS